MITTINVEADGQVNRGWKARAFASAFVFATECERE